MSYKIKYTQRLFLIILIIFPSFVLAHGGGIDYSGGHKDKYNKSGLGRYHYHCGGHQAHLHENELCPYDETVEDIGIEFKNNPSCISVGESIQLLANITSSNATDNDIMWSTIDSSIATVSDTGILTGHNPGTTTVVAETESACNYFTVFVNGVEAEDIEVSLLNSDGPLLIKNNPTKLTTVITEVGSELTLYSCVLPEDTINTDVEWYVDDIDKAFFDDGILQASSIGVVTLTAETYNGIYKDVKIIICPDFKLILLTLFLVYTVVLIYIVCILLRKRRFRG